jgi:uncharacterized protein (TIGR04222 family)
MQNSDRALWDRLRGFEIDRPGAVLTFTRRLARENGWELAYAERVVAEYKRFVFLAMTAGHVVSPSEHVDQAWHLHLTYTHSYWNNLCRDLLGKPLHHCPTEGRTGEQAKFVGLYEQTLASYRRQFGCEPPTDIWPAAHQRFGEDLDHVTVNRRRYWIIPRPHWPFARARPPYASLAAALLIALPLAAGWNPLDWRGPDFLVLYLAVAAVAAALAVAARWLLAGNAPWPTEAGQRPLDPYEVACLAAGPGRAVQAAFAAMVRAGTLRLEKAETRFLGLIPRTTRRIEPGESLPATAPLLERALYDAAAEAPSKLEPLVKAGLPIAEQIRDSLIRRSLMRSQRPDGASVVAGLVMASPLVLGVPKIFVGLERGRPVAFLVVLCVLTVAAAIVFLLARSRMTPAGNALLDSLKGQLASHSKLDGQAAAALPPAQLAMAIGLFGAGMLAAGPLASVHAMLPRASGGAGCTSGGCSGAGCGGGGCGGGGCGGGGCGGCGGGD